MAVTIQQPKLLGIREDPYRRAREEKALGRKVIGVTPMHFPEELIHASGAFPVLLQASVEPITIGGSHIFPYFCAFSRSNVDLGMKGGLDFFDAVIVSDMCLQVRTAFGILDQMGRVPIVHQWWPLEYSQERWLGTAIARLARTRAAVEAVVGQPITDEALARSISLYNRNRSLLRSLSALRRAKPGAISARQMDALVMASMVTPKEEHNQVVEGLLAELERIPAAARSRPRVFLSGHLCHAPDPEILDLVEQSGADVVGDDLYTGGRYYAASVPEDRPPMEALAVRYFDPGVPCPTKCGPEKDWGDYLIEQVDATGAQGLISLLPKHCEPHMFYYPYLRKRLGERGIPIVFIETEHEVLGLEGVRTRIQALVETLAGGVR